ncbi:terminase small subunit-like protein [Sneathiella chinensis]|uniref:Uncharacterized protein n=1 Tax=Sneathiella chinensis TaxID=349750 RepID=A0ABQ5U717_9PROT|nr:hypothetical protein [Sneathiella chinensis]GLQ07520.1 hypothetical protein GCM10007924_27410 [Sneathiella chinensis]
MVLSRKNALEALRSAIQNRIFGSNSDFSLLKELGKKSRVQELLSLAGTVFNKKEDERVRLFLADYFAGEIVTIADSDDAETPDGREAVARSKLRIDTRKWLMEQFAPQRYAPQRSGRESGERTSIFRTRVYVPSNGRD